MTVRELIIELLNYSMESTVVLQAGLDPIANLGLQQVHHQLNKHGSVVRLSFDRPKDKR